MTIEIPIDVWDPARGGAEGYLWRLARGLGRRGHRVRILCLRSNPLFEEEVEVARLAAPRWPRFLRELAFARAARARRRSGRADLTLAVRHSFEADLYQPHGGPFPVALRESLAAVGPAPLRWLKLGLRLLRPATRLLLRLERALLEDPRLRVLSLSRMVEEDFRRAYPGALFRFERIYNGVDLTEFHGNDRPEASRQLRARFGIPPAGRIGLFVGHKLAPKGLRTALEALPRLPALHLVVLGGGRSGPFLRLARKLGAAERVHFAGAAADPRPFYAGAEVLVHPTHYDPCSLAVLEALACGTPVVTTTRNGAGELLRAGRDGLVVPPRDPQALASAVEEVLGEWPRFHRSALERAGQLSFEAHLDAMERVMKECLVERRAREGSVTSGPR